MVELLELSPSELERPEFVDFFSGNRLLPGSETYAHCYCGHQFGFFSGQVLRGGPGRRLWWVLAAPPHQWLTPLAWAVSWWYSWATALRSRWARW